MQKKKKSINFEPEDFKFLQAEANMKYEGNLSIVLRKIIKEYIEKKKQEIH